MSVHMRSKIKNFITDLDRFLFSRSHFEQLAIFRIMLCSTLFYIACFRQMNIDQLGPNSLIPRELALSVFPDFYRPVVQWFFWPDSYVGTVHMILISLLFLASIGLTNRALLLVTWIIHQGILNRNYAMLFGADVIGGLFLFYLSFTKCNECYSVRRLIFKSESQIQKPVDPISSAFFRIMQIQICVIYMYTGFEKLKGNSWWDGTALWTVFANPQFSQYDFKFLSHVPLFFAGATFLSLVFEIYFAPMMLQQRYRNIWLSAGVLFHLSIGILLGLMPFSMVMISTYVLFLKQEMIHKWINQLSILFKSIRRV